MIEKPCLAKSNGIEYGLKWSSPPSMCKGVLGLIYQAQKLSVQIQMFEVRIIPIAGREG